MKTKLIAVLLVAFVLTLKSYGQFTFGVSPGIGLNSTYFGYKIKGKIIPFVGFQYLHAKVKYVVTGEEFDYDLYRVVSYSDETEFKGSLYLPNIGVKYFLKQHNKIQPYVTLCLSKPFVSGKLKYDGEIDEDFKDIIKGIGMWGTELGFGVEYFFDENFSLGGEFGFRYLHLKYEHTYEDTFYNPIDDEYVDTEIEEDFRTNLNPTFSKISLNFYF